MSLQTHMYILCKTDFQYYSKSLITFFFKVEKNTDENVWLLRGDVYLNWQADFIFSELLIFISDIPMKI